MANEVNIGQLTASQQEALQMYTSITNDDPITAIPLLQRSAWNVQIAVTKRFDGEQPDPVAEAQAAANNARPAQSSRTAQNLQYEALRSAASSRPRPDTVSRIPPQPPSPTTYRAPALLSLLFAPFNLAYRMFTTLFSYLPFLPRLFSRFTSLSTSSHPTSSSTTGRRPLPPSDAATRFIREFTEEYNTDPSSPSLPFTEASFNTCLDRAKSSLQYLLVILVSPEHDSTPSWIRSTLLSTQFHQFLTSHSDNVILWAGTVLDPEPYSLATQLNVTKFPFAALIAHDPAAGSNAMCTIARCVGPLRPTELVAKLATAMTEHDEKLVTVRVQRQEQAAQRNLRKEQESAYEKSLAQDREKARKRKEEEEKKANEEKAALEAARREEVERKNLERWRRWRGARVQPEPEPGSEGDAKDVIRISIRMQNGERVVRKFRANAELEELYAFVECFDVVKQREGESGEDEKVDELEPPPSDYQHMYPFRLVSSMPRKVYALDEGKNENGGGEDGGRIGDKVGKGANLIVESALEEDEEDANKE